MVSCWTAMHADQIAARQTDRVSVPKPQAGASVRRVVPHVLAVLLAVVLGLALPLNWARFVSGSATQWSDDAYLQSDLTRLSALVAAPVSRVLVDDFQEVRGGDLLVELDDRVYRAELAKAEADMAAAAAALENLKSKEALQQANIEAAEAAIAQARASSNRDVLEAERQKTLYATGIAGTRQKVEQADAAREISAAQVSQALANLAAARQQLAVLKSEEAQLEAAIRAAAASRDLARINFGYTRIEAPFHGIVSRRLAFPGQYLGVGTQVISVVPLPDVYVIANFKETQLTRMRPGDRAEVRVDTFPNVVLHGRVAAWSPGTGSVFALLPPDNATGNFTKVVQRIPVKIVLDVDRGLKSRLRAGMSVTVTVLTGDHPG